MLFRSVIRPHPARGNAASQAAAKFTIAYPFNGRANAGTKASARFIYTPIPYVELLAARPDGTGGWELSVVRRGRLAAAGVAPRGVPPWPVVDALLATADVVESVRRRKEPGEIDRIRAACAIADDALTELLPTLADGPTATAFQDAYARHYANAPHVRLMPTPASGKLDALALNDTDDMEVFVFGNPAQRQVVLVARLDNLGKGASGAAVQNLDLMIAGRA